VETIKITGFQCVDENATKHDVTLQTAVSEDVTEARNYDVNADVIDEKFKSTEMVRKIDEQRLMYNMPITSTWKTYEEEQLTYEPENQQVHKEVVIRSRSLLNLQNEPAELTTSEPQTLIKTTTTSGNRSAKKYAKQKPVVIEATPAKKYSSAINLTLVKDDSSKSTGSIKYKSQSDLCAAIAVEPKKLERPKSMDFLGDKEIKSHADALKKHFYYHPLKPNKKLNDNELPDPDKVLSTRQLFQKELKIPLPPSMNNQNPKTGPRPTQEVRVVPDTYRSKLKKCASVDMGTNIHNRWTDSGSVSSGVGSEASFDTESSGTNHRAGGYSSDDEDYVTEKATVEIIGRPVSAEILNKIRKFGTSVTYYGGKVISSSRGAVCSPMTMTIMDEIRDQKEENVKLRLVKSNSCGSRIELMEEPPKRNEKQVEAIQEEDEDEERRNGSGPRTVDSSSTSGSSKLSSGSAADEMSWKALIVIRKKATSAVPVFDMEFEEFEVLEEKAG